jgi:hypothetical protein
MSQDGGAKRQAGRRVENVVAVAVLSLADVLSSVSAWPGSCERAFWSAAVCFALFYGAGCFSIWYEDHPTQVERDKRAAPWFLHMYWLNAFGCFVGWIAVRLLWTRHVNGGTLGGMDVLLTLVAFLGSSVGCHTPSWGSRWPRGAPPPSCWIWCRP